MPGKGKVRRGESLVGRFRAWKRKEGVRGCGKKVRKRGRGGDGLK